MSKKSLTTLIITLFLAVVFCCPSTVFARNNSPGGAAGEPLMRSPLRLTFSYGDNLLVSDYNLGRILMVNRRFLKVSRWFSLEGKPLGIVCAKGYIYVGNETTGRIEVYNHSGEKQGTPVFLEPVSKPTDLAADTERNYLFAVDGVEKCVKVFSLEGKFLHSFPPFNPDNPLLANPTAIALDTAKQEVYVSDYGDPGHAIAARVQVFDYQGILVGTITGQGTGMLAKPRFSRPQGLAVDDSGHLFLVDCFSGEILVFDPVSGTLLKTLGGFGTEPGQLQLPLDIVIDPSTKDIYVTNNRAARVDIFPKGGQL